MALNNQTATVTLNINNEDAKKRLDDLNKQAVALSESIKKAYEVKDMKGAKKLTAELKKVNKEAADIKKNADNINVAMSSISTATPKELNNILKQINRELSSGNVKRGTAEWDAYNQKLIQVKAELAKINAEQKAAVPLFDRMQNAWQRYQGVAVAGAAAVAGALTAVSAMRKYRNEKDTAVASLQALTGLDNKSVDWLKTQAEELSQTMDETGLRVTQSAAEILEAYKLVGSAKPELLGVKEDLNAVTVECIRLSQAAGISLNDAVKATTISMNQFGASAEETDEYVNVLAAGSKVGAVAVENINEAVVRSGVAASQAGLSIQDLVGAIETIGERGLQGAKAGTGLKTFFLKLATGADDTNPKIVGLSQALQNLADKHLSEAEMVKMFGAEAYNVASILVNSADKFDYYKNAVTGTNIAVEQAARMGETFAAKSAQLKNQLAEIGQEIYKDIQPAISLFMSKSTVMLKLVGTLIQIFKKYGTAILAVVAPIVAYNAAIAISNVLHSKGVVAIVQYIKALFSMNTITKTATAVKYLFAAATALVTGNVKKATVAFKAFSRVLAMNPIGLVAAAIAAVVVGLIAWTKRSKELTQEQKNQKAIAEMNLDIEKKVNDQTADEISKIERLRAAIHDKNASEKKRLQAIKDLQKIIPGYNAQISKEGNIINENTKAIDNYINRLKEVARAKAAEEKLTEVIKSRLSAESERDAALGNIERYKEAWEEYEAEIERWTKLGGKRRDFAREDNPRYAALSQNAKKVADIERKWIYQGTPEFSDNWFDEQTEKAKKLKDEISQLKAQEEALLDYIRKNENITLPGGQEESEEENAGPQKSVDERLKLIELEAKRRDDENQKMWAESKRSLEEYEIEKINIEKWAIEQKRSLYAVGTSEWYDYNKELYNIQNKYTEQRVKSIDREVEMLKAGQAAAFGRWEITSREYQSNIVDIELNALRQKLLLYRENQDEYFKIQKQIDAKLAEQGKARLAKSKDEIDEENKLIVNELAMRLAKGLMTEEEYNEAIYQNEIEHLEKMHDLYGIYADEYVAITKKIEEAKIKHQADAAKRYSDNLRKFNSQYTDKIAVQEYNQGAASIDEMQRRGDITPEAAQQAKTDLGQKLLDAQVKLIQGQNLTIVDTYKARYEAIKLLEEQGVIDHAQAEQSKLQATTDMLNQLSAIYEGAWDSINTVLSASSQLMQANADLETTKIENEYERRIEAAGKNTRKVEKLEKERDEKVRAIKTQANEKAMKIELAQAIAGTATAAINAYSSASAIPVAGWVLGPIAAAAALAAGAIQIATIKKQHQAEAAGYAQGGFTPNGRWDEPQGVVHSNEFVANRKAVANPEIRPALNLIDRAQRNNTVGSLTAEDVSASLYSRTSPDVVKAVNASREQSQALPLESEATAAALEATANVVAQSTDVLRRLSEQLDEGITAIASIDGRNGIDKQQKKYNQLINNAR